MVGVLAVVLSASPFVAVDGGYRAETQLPVSHRTIEAFARSSAMQPLVVSDGDAPDTRLAFSIESSPAPALDDAGVVFYGDALVTIAEPLTLRIKRSGSLTITPQQRASRGDLNKLYFDLPAASFALIPSVPFEELSGGRLRVVHPTASIDVQLQVSGPPVPWPVLGGYQSWGACIVWDAARGRLMRFGGGDAFELDPKTSVWDPITGWQELPIASPQGRVRASMVYDSQRQRVVLFGGMGASGPLADTWEFDGTQWIEVTPASGPSARWSHGAAYDENAHEMIVFGGLRGTDETNSELGDTWRWDGFVWTELQPANSPSRRDAFGMTWDGTRQRITLVAGWNGGVALNDAWAWVSGTWQPLASLPGSIRASTALAWSPVSHDLLLVGGWDPRGAGGQTLYLGDTWRFDGNAWTPGPPLPRPTARLALTGHPTMGVVMLGGRSELTTTNPTTKLYSAELAKLEPAWQRLPQGEVTERGPVFKARIGLFTFGGQHYAWRHEGGVWVPYWRPPEGARIVAGGDDNLLVESDGGLQLWSTLSGMPLSGPQPPAFRFISDQLRWVVDLDGGLRTQNRSWDSIGTLPPDVRAIRDGIAVDEYFVWTDRLLRWTPLDGGLVSFGNALAIDGGITLGLPIVAGQIPQPIAIEERGAWHASLSGFWVYVGLPSLPDLVTGDQVLTTDAGFSNYEFQKLLGAHCETGLQCPRGSCVSGRCCESTCSGDCAACSVAEGSPADGVCWPARAGRVCLDTGCTQARCSGNTFVCGTPPPCMDAGMEEEPTPTRDAGVRPRDAGRPMEPEPVPPPGCGCQASPAGFVMALLLWLRRSQRKATRGSRLIARS